VLLNPTAVSQRLRELELKQWWVARQIGVTKLTVNRWLTGRIRRVSRDNMGRLATLLRCEPELLCLADDGEVCATQLEQSAAAKGLVARRAQLLFLKSNQMELYERLLKAVTHPNIPVSELTDIYSSLTFAAAQQGKLDQVQQYARLSLEYALRSGNIDKEFTARNNLVAALGEGGQLEESIRGLRELVSAAESIGHHRGVAVANLNLGYALRIQGDVREAVKAVNHSVAYFIGTTMVWGMMHAFSNASTLAADLGAFEQARELRREAMRRVKGEESVAELVSTEVFELLLDSLLGREVDLQRLEQLIPEYSLSMRVAEGKTIWPSIILRRAGELDRAAQFLDEAAGSDVLRVYDPPLITEEHARIAWAQGDKRRAQRLRDKANRQLSALGMGKRCTDDPSIELGALFSSMRRLKIVLPEAS
jgi:tetratricopeptide (TPR) repeat protein